MKPTPWKRLKNLSFPTKAYIVYAPQNGQVMVEFINVNTHHVWKTEFIPEEEIKLWVKKKQWNEYKVLKRTKLPKGLQNGNKSTEGKEANQG